MNRKQYDPNEFIMQDGICIIRLYDQKGNYKAEAIIDQEEYVKISGYKWYHRTTDGYVATNMNKKTIFLHNVIMGFKWVDHKDGNKLDNRKSNLRGCNRSQNQFNRKLNKNNTSGHKGVYWNKRCRKWCAYISINKKRKTLGYFADKECAIHYRQEMADKYYGEFNRLI